jgi:hypothetical protein
MTGDLNMFEACYHGDPVILRHATVSLFGTINADHRATGRLFRWGG